MECNFDILRKKPEGFNLVSGDDEYTLPVTLAGGNGVISVIAQAYPKEFSTRGYGEFCSKTAATKASLGSL